MPVLREWRAEIRRALKDEYVQYVKATGSQCGKKVAEVVAVARPRPRGIPKNPH